MGLKCQSLLNEVEKMTPINVVFEKKKAKEKKHPIC